MLHSIRHIFIVFFIFIITAATVSAQTEGITLAWDPNAAADQVTEYRLYYKTGTSGPPYDGTGLDQGDSPIIIPVANLADENNPEFNLTGLSTSVTYRFALTASNGVIESGYSNEVQFTYEVQVDDDYDGYTENQGDCDDADSSINPDATEICGDSIDQDCNGSDLICGEDIDDDYDDFTENQGDCDDTDIFVNPNATEICDGIDNDCDGQTDEGCTVIDNPPSVSISIPDPVASFDSGILILFAGSASDAEDGDLTNSLDWTSDLDGLFGASGSFSVVLSDGTHTITASVTDSAGNTNNDSITITVGSISEGDFTLSVNAYKIKGHKYANLTWSGANSADVDVYRDGGPIDTTADDGEYIHGPFSAGKPATYQVCEAGTSTCSNEITVSW